MRPISGKRDTLITFEQRETAQEGVYGTQEVTWAVYAQEWAEVQDMLPSRTESVDDGISMQRRPCRVRCLYRDDITSDMRISYEGRTLRIVSGPAELGRRDGLEMMAEELSTEGKAP